MLCCLIRQKINRKSCRVFKIWYRKSKRFCSERPVCHLHRLLHRWHQTGIIFCFNSTCFFKHLLHQLRWKKMTIKESCRPFFTQRSLTHYSQTKQRAIGEHEIERESEWKWRRKERSTIRSLGLKANGSVDGSMPAVKLSKTTIRTHNFSKLVCSLPIW